MLAAERKVVLSDLAKYDGCGEIALGDPEGEDDPAAPPQELAEEGAPGEPSVAAASGPQWGGHDSDLAGS